MECFKIENLSFSYPNKKNKAIDNISITVNSGEFITLCGKSGCGKTTFLRLLKSVLAPHGVMDGKIYFYGKELEQTDLKEQAAKIGFVMQSCENQIVTDKVWHELAFGLESLGYSTPEIRTRVAETASFFGIQTWFHKNVAELSGGQKQLLNLASVMVMQPDVLILDEPTSQLDPIAAQEFIKTLEKINHELGTTVILSEHRLEDVFEVSERVVVMDSGKIIADAEPKKIGEILKKLNHNMMLALPTPMRVFYAVENGLESPLNVGEGRRWLERYAEKNPLNKSATIEAPQKADFKTAIELRDVWFRYEKKSPDIIKGLNLKINKGELFGIVGGNGTGKTTTLSLMSGLCAPYRGEVLVNGENILKTNKLYDGIFGVLPQNPQSIFAKKTLFLDLADVLSEKKISEKEKEKLVKKAASVCRVEKLLESHPYDLSGGEQQRAALAKVLLTKPQILLLDEPTKGLDAHFKKIFANILNNLKNNGITVVMVTHDIEFCAEYADRCAMLFDGNVTSVGEPKEFFCGKNFYTTCASRMARTTLPQAVTAHDIIIACGGKLPQDITETKETPIDIFNGNEEKETAKRTNLVKKLNPKRIALGCVFALLFFVTAIVSFFESEMPKIAAANVFGIKITQLAAVTEAIAAMLCFFPQKKYNSNDICFSNDEKKLDKRTVAATFIALIAIPLTIYFGISFLGDRKYYFISLLIILETLIPFCLVFESRKPQAREIVVISVLCAIGVAGRTAFFMLPQFKPVVAVVIISGVCFGGETGFLVGAVTAFVSNFFFGQGQWTPWQMFAFGVIGFIAGVLFKKGFLKRTKTSLCVFGFFVTLIVYGGIMNPSSVIMSQSEPNLKMILAAYATGFPLDLVHAASSAFFLWFIAEPMIDKLERIKVKYGLIER